jgi:hypothetical protein
MGCMLKRQLFTALPMPTRVIKWVDRIGAREAQGWEFRFLNQNKDAFTWTDKVLADDPAFQGLLRRQYTPTSLQSIQECLWKRRLLTTRP